MKKLFAAAMAVAVLASAGAAANTEMDINVYGAPLAKLKFDKCEADEVKLDFPVGAQLKWGFFFISPAKFLDIGLNFSFGLDYCGSGKIKPNYDFDYDDDDDYDDYAYGGYGGYYDDDDEEEEEGDIDDFTMIRSNLVLGPVVRFNLGDMHSIYVSPGIAFDMAGIFGDDILCFAMAPAFDLDVGYRFWLVNKKDFHFGFDVGGDFNFPLGGKVKGDVEGDINGGADAKIYAGVCFNFGKKSPDKFRD